MNRSGRTDSTRPSGPCCTCRTSAMTTAASAAHRRNPPRYIQVGTSPPPVPARTQQTPSATAQTGAARWSSRRARGPGWGRAATSMARAMPPNMSKRCVSVP